MKIRTLKALVLAMSLAGAAQAQAGDVKWDLGLGYDVGGDRLGTVSVNGSDTNVNTNKGVAFTIGAAMVNDEAKQFETSATIGYKTGGPKADNGTVSFSSIPLTIMQYYRPNDMRLGVGLNYNISPEYKQSIDGRTDNGGISFDDTLGLVAQIGWAPPAQKFSIDLRYTSIKYKASAAKFGNVNYNVSNVDKFDGSSVGFYTSIRF
jgi:outer membrane protein W